MPKQIQIGYDKVPAPVTKQFQQLVDIEGIPLTDAAGNALVTEENSTLSAFARAEGSLSVVVNNKGPKQSAPVFEVFPSESEVSSSLLGVPRAEEQLSLFSDVSTYGFDEDNWNYYTFTNQRTYPQEWYRKENTVYGRRRYPTFKEGSEEQALYFESFPSQWTFPEGPVAAQASTPTNRFKEYMNFIALGKFLYSIFKDINPTFARLNLLDENIKIVDITISDVDDPADAEVPVQRTILNPFTLSRTSDYFEVDYGDDLQAAFDQIERWTQFFYDIRDGVAKFPKLEGSAITDFTQLGSEYSAIVNFTALCRPGGSDEVESFGILESKKTFRYQPGRISGFTFGIRLQADPSTSANFIEWGCSNSTDEYMFQLIGQRLNIVRRSSIKMPDELLLRQGLELTDQTPEPIYPKGLGSKTPLYETVIERRNFNGDKLDGSGESGYILSFEDVTMFKIEFSWYGAIGAKFYAYVPASNGDARWVLMHTFVIENGMDEPVLRNPDMKFKYLIYSSNTSGITRPLYIYKYGSSYYVDGGDEGTISLSTFTGDAKGITERTPLIGILPKSVILNQDGIEIENFKKGYPDTISVSSDITARIDIEEVIGSPSGQHFNYSPSLQNGKHPYSRTLDFRYLNSGQIEVLTLPEVSSTDIGFRNVFGVNEDPVRHIFSTTVDLTVFQPGDNVKISGGSNDTFVFLVKDAVFDNGEYILDVREIFDELVPETNPPSNITISSIGLTPEDDKAKLVGDGVYNVYVDYSGTTPTTFDVIRVNGNKYNQTNGTVLRSLKFDNTVIDPIRGDTFTARLSNYRTLAASTVPINENTFVVHFLVPSRRDQETNGRHFADFAVSLSYREPRIVQNQFGDSSLVFGQDDRVFNRDDLPFVEYTHYESQYNYRLKAEQTEWDPAFGDRFMVDSRLDRPAGDDSGYIAAVRGEIRLIRSDILNYQSNQDDPTLSATQYRIFYTSSAPAANLFEQGTNIVLTDDSPEVGINGEYSGFKFVGAPVTRPGDTLQSSIIELYEGGVGKTIDDIMTAGAIETKTITLKDEWQLETVDENGLPKYDQQDFSESKAIPFNSQPMYLIFAFKDYAQVNNISVEEITAETTYTHTPKFITADSHLTTINSGLSTNVDSPSNFTSDQRLSGLRYDSQTLNPLRPSESVINSFYVSAGEPVTFSLKNIFNRDRKGIAPGLLNNRAIFFTGTSVDGTPGNVEITLTTKEQ